MCLPKQGTLESSISLMMKGKGQLLTFGEYKDGQRCGSWFFFDDLGHLWMIFKDFAKNTYTIVNEGDGRKYIPDFKYYYPNGNIEKEGTFIVRG